MKLVHHHLHMRKRKADGLEPYPARDSRLRFLDRLVLAVGILGPLTALPQAVKTFTLQDATGVSLAAWALPGLFNIPWIIYGLVHREWPIVVTYTLWLVMNILISVGVLLYS